MESVDWVINSKMGRMRDGFVKMGRGCRIECKEWI